MLTELNFIFNFVLEAFLHIWPYLLITIPIAVAVNMSGAAKYIDGALRARPITAIFLATLVGAFSPFCSCGVIPLVAALLIGGVPLAPVMAFWIASPSMDPEIFFLSVAMVGWELAVWRVAATLILSLTAGFITHLAMQRGWLGNTILRTQDVPTTQSMWALFQGAWQGMLAWFKLKPAMPLNNGTPSLATATSSGQITLSDDWQATGPIANDTCDTPVAEAAACCGSNEAITEDAASCDVSCAPKQPSFKQRLFDETWAAAALVVKFMLLAFILEAIIIRYVPSAWIINLLGQQNPYAIVTAALVGVPVYTTSIAALPMISGLLAQGMSAAAALAFMVAGPTTTLPAMAAVWGIATRRVFGLYVAFSLLGAVMIGYVYQIFQ